VSDRHRPFCDGDPAAEAAFDARHDYLTAHGLEDITRDDLCVIGRLALAETILERLRRLNLDENAAAIARAGRDYDAALAQAERAFGQRIGEPAEQEPVKTAPPLRLVKARPDRGTEEVRARIFAALAGGVRLTKDELRARVKGKHKTFLAVVAQLVRDREIHRGGTGLAGSAFVYALRSTDARTTA
jgi:hypothetical protein